MAAYGDPWCWQLRQICDVSVQNSPLVLYTDFHYLSFLSKLHFPPYLLLKYNMATMILHAFLKELGQLLNWPFIKMKISGNLCTKPMASSPYLHHRYWLSCQLKDPHRRPLRRFNKTLKIHNSWTDYPILLKLSPFSFSSFSAFIECT